MKVIEKNLSEIINRTAVLSCILIAQCTCLVVITRMRMHKLFELNNML